MERRVGRSVCEGIGTKEEIDKFVLENIRTIFDPDSVFVAKLISGKL